jgi:hypothetical protein
MQRSDEAPARRISAIVGAMSEALPRSVGRAPTSAALRCGTLERAATVTACCKVDGAPVYSEE